jgi:hypothetical protein
LRRGFAGAWEILGEEMTIGLRKDSVLLLAMGSIKQDLVNLDLF